MDDATRTQLRLLGEIRDALAAAGVRWWLFGGWAMDFHAGEVTRDHSDIEAFVRKDDAEAVRRALTAAGFAAPPPLHPDEALPHLKDGQEAGFFYLVEDEAGRTITPGRWADWPWAAGAFDGPPLRLGDLELHAMSLDGLLDMKLNFPKHTHGAPLREKDVADIERLRALAARH
ncbi:MAG: aminoglycoside adenylyltransferase [Dehalococcoidia bacterium]